MNRLTFRKGKLRKRTILYYLLLDGKRVSLTFIEQMNDREIYYAKLYGEWICDRYAVKRNDIYVAKPWYSLQQAKQALVQAFNEYHQ